MSIQKLLSRLFWKDILVDGHNRYEICTKHKLPFKTNSMIFDDREEVEIWIIQNQFGRRNLDMYQKAKLALKLESVIAIKAKKNLVLTAKNADNYNPKKQDSVYQKSDDLKNLENNEPISKPILSITPINTNKELALIAGISHDTIAKVKKIQEKATPEQKERLENSAASINEIYKVIRKEENRIDRVAHIIQTSTNFKPLNNAITCRYPIIYVDCPFRYEHTYDKSDAIENNYPTMTLSELCELPVQDISTPDSILYFWSPAPKVAESLEIIKAWGFTYRTCAIWDKKSMGLGHWFRAQHELLLLAVKGNPPIPKEENRYSSVYSEARGNHSVKPLHYYEIIETMYPEFPKIELFARQKREGWAVWGNQVE